MQSLRQRTFISSLAVAAALATGCGSSAGSSQDTSAAAGAVPAGALAYLDVNVDHGSDAWKQFTAVGERFPSWQRVAGALEKGFNDNEDGATFGQDVAPWLGGQAAVALTGMTADGPRYVVYMASDDDEAAKQAEERKKGNEADGSYKGYDQFVRGDTTTAIGNGAVLVANDEATLHAAIDAREGDADSLADDARFTAALDALPAESFVRGWADASKLGQLTSLASLPGVASGPEAAQLQQLAKALHRINSASFALWATDGGFNARVNVTAKDSSGGGLLDGVTFRSGLSDLVPSDAYGYLAFKGADEQIDAQTKDNAMFRALERQTGISVLNDIVPLFNGEGVLYAGPGLPFRGALMLDPNDPAAARGALTRLVSSIAKLENDVRVTDLPGGGQQVELAPGFSVFWRQVPGGPLVLGNDQDAGSAPAATLVGSPAYQAFLDKAGVGDGTVSLYLDVPATLSFLPDLPPDARPVGGIAVWSSKSGNTATANLFVEIKG
jgi:hypothetical protein